jgi:hypothetical protein
VVVVVGSSSITSHASRKKSREVGDDLSVVVVRLVIDRGDGSSLGVGSHVVEVLVVLRYWSQGLRQGLG